MRTFLNVPLLDINRTYQLFSHCICVILFTNITMFTYSEQVQVLNSTVQVLEIIWMLNELIQANEMFFMNIWYIEHTTVQVLEMILMLK